MPSAHPELLALLRDCKEVPEDASRLVLADWLEDRGEMTRARLVRLQCQAARMPIRQQRHQRTHQRIQALVEACGPWLRPLRQAGLEVTVERGLLSVNAALGAVNDAEVR